MIDLRIIRICLLIIKTICCISLLSDKVNNKVWNYKKIESVSAENNLSDHILYRENVSKTLAIKKNLTGSNLAENNFI